MNYVVFMALVYSTANSEDNCLDFVRLKFIMIVDNCSKISASYEFCKNYNLWVSLKNPRILANMGYSNYSSQNLYLMADRTHRSRPVEYLGRKMFFCRIIDNSVYLNKIGVYSCKAPLSKLFYYIVLVIKPQLNCIPC